MSIDVRDMVLSDLRPLVETLLDLYHAEIIDRDETRRLLGIDAALGGGAEEAEALANFAEPVESCEIAPDPACVAGPRESGEPCYLGTDIPIEAGDVVIVRWSSLPPNLARVVDVQTSAGVVVAAVEDAEDGRYAICPLVRNGKGEPYLTYVDFDEDDLPLEDLRGAYAWALER